MKKYFLIFICFSLFGCNEIQQNNEKDSSNKIGLEKKEELQNNVIAEEESIQDSATAIRVDNEQLKKVICFNQEITSYFGFDEESEDIQCKKIKDFHLEIYRCELSKNAFGAELDAIVLENSNQRIYAYTNSKDCEKALDIRNSNGP
jgi:hypothetical protein